MHPKNIFSTNPPDFKKLAIKYPQFRCFAKLGYGGKIIYNFENEEAVKILSEVLLAEYFSLNVDLTNSSLIPRIPQRVDYILLIEDLLHKNNIVSDGIIGIDIGTGSSCIFPLLGYKIKGWSFVATDIDENSLFHAEQNISKNNLNGKIRLIHSSADKIFESIFTSDDYKNTTFAFSMCNPPFFDPDENKQRFYLTKSGNSASKEELINFRNGSNPPRSITKAKLHEVYAQGGEVEFVGKMIEQSFQFRGQIRLFSSMIGRKASLNPLKNLLMDKNALFRIYSFKQGKTTRWFLVWTYDQNIKLSYISDAE